VHRSGAEHTHLFPGNGPLTTKAEKASFPRAFNRAYTTGPRSGKLWGRPMGATRREWTRVDSWHYCTRTRTLLDTGGPCGRRRSPPPPAEKRRPRRELISVYHAIPRWFPSAPWTPQGRATRRPIVRGVLHPFIGDSSRARPFVRPKVKRPTLGVERARAGGFLFENCLLTPRPGWNPPLRRRCRLYNPAACLADN